jgi:hypothetical protein
MIVLEPLPNTLGAMLLAEGGGCNTTAHARIPDEHRTIDLSNPNQNVIDVKWIIP